MKSFVGHSAGTVIAVLVAGLSLILSTYILGKAYKSRTAGTNSIQVKGVAKKDFKADKVIWTIQVGDTHPTAEEAFKALETDLQTAIDFLKNHGFTEQEIEVGRLIFDESYEDFFDEGQQRWIKKRVGYKATQIVTVSSNQVDLVEDISGKITNLMKSGVMLQSGDPKFYYSKLADLKHDLLGEAAADALRRAEEIAESSHAKVKRLKSAKMGVFQILGKYSNEDYSWGGTFNTRAKEKEIHITIQAEYLFR